MCYSTPTSLLYAYVCPDAVPLKTCMLDFLEFLQKFPKPVLVAHNVHNFDGPILCTELCQVNLLAGFKASVCGMMDTLQLFRSFHQHLSSHRQESLTTTILNDVYNAHNSLDVVKLLERFWLELNNHFNLSFSTMFHFHTSLTNWLMKIWRKLPWQLCTPYFSSRFSWLKWLEKLQELDCVTWSKPFWVMAVTDLRPFWRGLMTENHV